MSAAVLARPRQRWGWLALAFVLLTLMLPRSSLASGPVIPPGKEDEIRSLLEPHALGDELTPGWTLHSFAVDSATIHFWIAGPDGEFALVSASHVDDAAPDSQLLPSFALSVVAQPAGSEAAVAALRNVLERNDDGSFWRTSGVWVRPSQEGSAEHLGQLHPWAKDGVVLLIAFTIVLLLLVGHVLRGAEASMKWSLLGVVLVAVALRLLLSPMVGMEAWPYTRYVLPARLVLEGPALAAAAGGPVWASEILHAITLVLSLLAPLAVFVHARYLLDDHRAALVVAGMLAVLPMHLRFSYSDVAFIPSITVSSVVFALVHAATRDVSRRLGWFAVAIIGFPLGVVYLVRPLNIMYFALLLATAFVNQGVHGRKHAIAKPRVLVAFAVITLVTMLGGVPWLLESFGREVRAGLSIETLRAALGVLWNPQKNALLHPGFTPPIVLALAVIGAVDLWRRGRRRLFGYLIAWLFGFLIAHAYAVPESVYMQARYHLHLVVPFLMLAGCGVEATLRWLAVARERTALAGRPAVALLLVIVAASPLVHLHFIRNTDLNEMHEWKFAHGLREQIPPRCDVIEYVGDTADPRMRRVGAYVEGGMPRSRWRVHEIARAGEGELALPTEIRELLENPPACLVWYEGLPCFGSKSPNEGKAPACREIEHAAALERIASAAFDSNVYDDNYGRGLGEIDRIELSLFRVYRRPSD